MEKSISIKSHAFLVNHLEKEYDLYEMYNDFVVDLTEFNKRVPDVVETIRDNYSEIFNKVPSGTYTIDEFEKLALGVL